ncbi:hypothetical protein CKY03_18455 [Photorhabdus sp. S9-53]|nr:hypothetical protein CKY03_18455 [Photorhabdus sp. S9-53]
MLVALLLQMQVVEMTSLLCLLFQLLLRIVLRSGMYLVLPNLVMHRSRKPESVHVMFQQNVALLMENLLITIRFSLMLICHSSLTAMVI